MSGKELEGISHMALGSGKGLGPDGVLLLVNLLGNASSLLLTSLILRSYSPTSLSSRSCPLQDSADLLGCVMEYYVV